MHKLVLIHPGETVRDLENRWTGWTDGDLNIPNGIPLVDGLDDDLKPIRHYYLGNTDAADKAAAPLAAHGDA